MRILLVCHLSNNGGIGSKTVELAYQLKKAGCEVLVIFINKKPTHYLLSKTPYSFHPRLSPRRISREALDFDPDIVLMAYSSYMGAGSKLTSISAPIVPIIHGQGVRFYGHGPTRRMVLKGLGARILRTYPHIIVLNRSLQEELCKMGVLKENITVLPNGIDTVAFQPRPCKKQFDLVFAGSIYKEKRMDILFKAVKIYERRGNELSLLILGEGPMLQEYKDLAKEMGVNAKFAGWKKDPATWYLKARAFVLSSDQEEFPSAPLEAMACGLPVICTRVGALSEILRPGKDAALVVPNDPSALADAICSVLNDHVFSSHLSAQGERTATEVYGWEKVATRYLEVLRTITRKI